MKARLVSVAVVVAILSAFLVSPASAAPAAKDRPHPLRGVKAHGHFGKATVNVTHFAVNAAGHLVASGTVTDAANKQLATFQDVAVTVQAVATTCTILDLTLAPINLNLLGLVVTTSTIHLKITADPSGGLLGSLLCGIAKLLDQPAALAPRLNRVLSLVGGSLTGGSVLTGMLPITITQFFSRNNHLFARFLVTTDRGRTFGPFATPVSAQASASSCTILHLVLGPLHLNLLGLVIDLTGAKATDPVVIDISAEPGPGNLLGNLLCGITKLLNQGAPAWRIALKLNQLLAYL